MANGLMAFGEMENNGKLENGLGLLRAYNSSRSLVFTRIHIPDEINILNYAS
jgi:hypothetical protein